MSPGRCTGPFGVLAKQFDGQHRGLWPQRAGELWGDASGAEAGCLPRLLEDGLAKRFPHAVLNVITAGVGGENSTKGLTRLQRDVIDHHPRVVLIDYALNDRGLTLDQSRQNLTAIIAAVRTAGACPILLTPTWDTQASPNAPTDKLALQATMIRSLASTKRVPLADSLKAFSQFRGDRSSLMAQSNHPNRAGHELVVQQLLPLFVPGK